MLSFLTLTILILLDPQQSVSCQRRSRNQEDYYRGRPRVPQNKESSTQENQESSTQECQGRRCRYPTRRRPRPSRIVEACPPLLGDDPPAGCSKSFVEDIDGNIPCTNDQDCPQNEEWYFDEVCNGNNTIRGPHIYLRECGNNGFCKWSCTKPKCKSRSMSYCKGRPSGSSVPKFVSPTSEVGVKSSCQNCEVIKQCPPHRPCKLGGECIEPYCNRRGRCWCVGRFG